jgi:very-short-patch-repair endonuclease
MNNHFYNKNLKQYARELRTESVSKAEKYIWKVLLSRKQMGFLVKRQRPILNFIVDFFIPDLGLIIEIDGISHLNKGSYDFYRQEKLQDLGFEIIRFSEGEVLTNISEIENQLIHIIQCRKETLCIS